MLSSIDNFLLFVEVFVFVMSLLNIILNLYRTVKAYVMKEGKADEDKFTKIIFGMSLSYAIACIAVGF